MQEDSLLSFTDLKMGMVQGISKTTSRMMLTLNLAQTTYAAPQQAQVAQQVMVPNPFTNDVIADQVRQANQVNQVVNPFEQQQPVISNPWEQQPVNTQAGIQPPAQPTLNNQNRGY